MKIACTFLFTSMVFFIYSCKPQASKGYEEIDELYKESVKALQTKDSAAIREFVEKAFPDEGTADYMYAKNYHYRGFPEALRGRPGLMDTMRIMYTRRLCTFCNELVERRLLDNLRFIGFNEKLVTDSMPNQKEILFAEPFGRFVSGNDTIEYKIGELLKVNGKWKSFSDPKL